GSRLCNMASPWPHKWGQSGGRPHTCPPEMGLGAGRIRTPLAPPQPPISRETTTWLGLSGFPVARRPLARPLLSAGHKHPAHDTHGRGFPPPQRLARARCRACTSVSSVAFDIGTHAKLSVLAEELYR